MILQLLKTFGDFIFPPPTAEQVMQKELDRENWKLNNTAIGIQLMEGEKSLVKMAHKANSKKEWEEFCVFMSDYWKRNGFRFKARYWLSKINTPPSRKRTAPPSNAKQTTVPPEQWETVNKDDPKYHNKAELTGQETELLAEKNLDQEKAMAIKFVLNQGYAISEDGYSNSVIAKKLSEQYGKGYGKDTIKVYAAILRSTRNQNAPAPIMEW